jgi:hypothetical protein
MSAMAPRGHGEKSADGSVKMGFLNRPQESRSRPQGNVSTRQSFARCSKKPASRCGIRTCSKLWRICNEPRSRPWTVPSHETPLLPEAQQRHHGQTYEEVIDGMR